MSETIPTVLMLPPHGRSDIERWIGKGRLAAASDLILRLKSAGRFNPVYLIAEQPEDLAALDRLGAIPWRREPGAFHFGEVLASFIASNRLDRVAYFGGASAPLLEQDALVQSADRLLQSEIPLVITNNLHSSDWFMTNAVEALQAYQVRFPSDNPVGWVLTEEARITVEAQPPSAATRLDLDTPTDFAMPSGHPAVGLHLRQFITELPAEILARVEAIKRVMQAPGNCLMVMGRCSSHLWQQLERSTQIWIRMLAEERGMVASQRLARGEVRSLIAELIREVGLPGFMRSLAELSDGVIWDTRVWMAAEIGWPSAQDRFASDLGRVDEIDDPTLRELAIAVQESPVPVLAGGYGVVSGGLYALLETINL